MQHSDSALKISEVAEDAAEDLKRSATADDADEDAEEEGGKEKVIIRRMSLRELSLSGMKLVEQSQTYTDLFDEEPNHISSTEIKVLEMKIELFLWDCGLGIQT